MLADISIPAPPRGASQALDLVIYGFQFQYQPLHEGLLRPRVVQEDAEISIPAPPRGASTPSAMHRTCDVISIPAPPRGASMNSEGYSDPTAISIPAPPRGASFRCLAPYTRLPHFNTSPSTRGFSGTEAEVVAREHFNTSPSTRGFSNIAR